MLDDRLLIEELLVGLPKTRRRVELYATSYWYYRACRAAVVAAGGHSRLNLLNLEATAMARLLGGTVWLSAESAAGILPAVFDDEGVAWATIAIT